MIAAAEMSLPTVLERIVALEPITRDDFIDKLPSAPSELDLDRATSSIAGDRHAPTRLDT